MSRGEDVRYWCFDMKSFLIYVSSMGVGFSSTLNRLQTVPYWNGQKYWNNYSRNQGKVVVF
jgi:hypothetical protein